MQRFYLLWVVLFVSLAGCGGNSTASYIPQTDAAEEALKLALDAWKNGQTADPAGKLQSGATVRAIDFEWSAGKKLAGYEVLQVLPAAPEGGPRKVAVELTFADGAPAVETAYFIVGIDPLQVCREQDYERTFGMAY